MVATGLLPNICNYVVDVIFVLINQLIIWIIGAIASHQNSCKINHQSDNLRDFFGRSHHIKIHVKLIINPIICGCPNNSIMCYNLEVVVFLDYE